MNNKLPIALISGLVFWGGLFMVFPPEILAAEGDILISDNFNDGKLDGWTVQYGNWYVNPQGNLAGSNSGKMLGGRINTSNPEWDNYRINLDINGFQGIDGYVGFRYIPNGNFYELNLRFGTGSYNTPEAILKKTENSTVTTLGDTHSLALKDNKWYHLIVEVSNENIKIWIDNNLIFDITDTGTKVKKGTLSLGYWTGDIGVAYMKFDNITVTAGPPAPLPRLPVIFIPGIGGSEFKASQDIIWSAADGHGGTYSHAYAGNEKIWVNQDKAAELGNDDYFDVLRLKTDGETSEAALSLTGDLTSFGYPDIDSFFTGMGYVKGTNYFVFPYDWRKDVRQTKDLLDALIETAKTASGQSKVNLVVHSMGGLVARFYISDPNKASKVNKLIELGVPHLGAPSAIKALVYGEPVGRWYFKIINIGVDGTEVKDVLQNFPSHHSLLPSIKYYDFYNDSIGNPYPFHDDRDIDNNNIIGVLNYDQTKNLLSNLNYNTAVFNTAEQFHNSLDPQFNQTNGTKVYEIVGSSQPTLGQIHETWWITWPINLLPKRDEIYINGDGTVPLYSASLKNDSLDISGAFKIYYVEQGHGDLVTSNGTAMQTVKAILNDDNALPVEVKDQKISLEGEQISLDDGELDLYDDENRHCGENANGEIEENIPDVICTSSSNTKHAFVKKKAKKVKVVVTRKKPTVKSKTTTVKKRTYKEDKISKTVIYKDLAIPQTGKAEFILDPAAETTPTLIFYADTSKPEETTIINSTSEVSGTSATDQTPPKTTIQISGTKDSSGIYNGPVTITLSGSDTDSGILRIEYSLDDGQTVQVYTKPFIISAPGKTTIQIKSTDKLGNEEIPQSITIEIAVPPSPTPDPILTNETNMTNSSNLTNSTNTNTVAANTSKVGSDSFEVDKPDILGLTFKNPSHISDQINVSNILGEQINPTSNKTIINPAAEILGGLLVVSGGIVTLASLGLIITFLKPIPGKM